MLIPSQFYRRQEFGDNLGVKSNVNRTVESPWKRFGVESSKQRVRNFRLRSPKRFAMEVWKVLFKSEHGTRAHSPPKNLETCLIPKPRVPEVLCFAHSTESRGTRNSTTDRKLSRPLRSLHRKISPTRQFLDPRDRCVPNSIVSRLVLHGIYRCFAITKGQDHHCSS